MEPGARQKGAVAEDGIAGIRHQNHIPGIRQRQGDVGKALLGSQKRHHLPIRIDGHPVPPLIPYSHRLVKLIQIPDGIDIIFSVTGRFRQRPDNMRCRRDIGSADAKINHFFSPRQLFPLFLQQHTENTGAKPVHTF